MRITWHDIPTSGMYEIDLFCKKYQIPNVDEVHDIIIGILTSFKEDVNDEFIKDHEYEIDEAKESGVEEGYQNGKDEAEEILYERGLEEGIKRGREEILQMQTNNLIFKDQAKEFVDKAYKSGYIRGWKTGTNWDKSEYDGITDERVNTHLKGEIVDIKNELETLKLRIEK